MSMEQPPPPPPPSGSGGGAPRPAMSNPLISYWKLVVLERYAQFTGRSRRAEFWWYFLANFIITVVLNILVGIASIFVVLYVIYALARADSRVRRRRYGDCTTPTRAVGGS